MAHSLKKSGYGKLLERLNRFPQGAPPSGLLLKILRMLFQEEEAALVSLLPIKPFNAEKAALVWKVPLTKARKMLDGLAGKALLLDMESDGGMLYILPPPMAGFFEFSLMRIRNDIDQKALSELFYEYLNKEEDFVRELFTHGETNIGRVFVNERALPREPRVQVLDYERASDVIRSATHRGVSLCYCRHKMHHVGKSCGAPLDICLTFNNSAASLVRHGHARPIDATEGLEILQKAYAHNLVQFGENVRRRVNFICNCCGCCCEAMLAARRFGMLQPVQTTNFLPELDEGACTGCGRCAAVCPVSAMEHLVAEDTRRPKNQKAKLNEDLCLGCGLCVRACANGGLILKPRPKRVITPLNSTHRVINMAIERGKLQNLIFDNQALLSHRAMAAILGVILRLPPIKQTLARRQLRSRYLETIIEKWKLG